MVARPLRSSSAINEMTILAMCWGAISSAARFHRVQTLLRERNRCAQVEIEHRVPFVLGRVGKPSLGTAPTAGVIDQDLNPTQPGGQLERRLAIARPGHLDSNRSGAAAIGADLGTDICGGVRVSVGYDDVSATIGQLNRDHSTQA
jgi:hypothetical protein